MHAQTSVMRPKRRLPDPASTLLCLHVGGGTAYVSSCVLVKVDPYASNMFV